MATFIGRAFSKVLRTYQTKANPIAYARKLGVKVGERCRLIDTSEATFGTEPYLISLGDHVTVTSGVRFLTHDGGVWVFRDEEPEIDVVDAITVGSNVFIGLNAIILPGVSIGENCVVGAGSVVAKSVPANSVVAGVPARVVRTIEEYRARTMSRALRIRSLPEKEKRQRLIASVAPKPEA